jgi:hypothetical protein
MSNMRRMKDIFGTFLILEFIGTVSSCIPLTILGLVYGWPSVLLNSVILTFLYYALEKR